MTLPFDVHILKQSPAQDASSTASSSGATPKDDPPFSHLLPASYRTGKDKDDLLVPSPSSVNFLEKELSVKALDDIKPWLWICGRPMPPRPLHHQILIRRNIAISEDPQHHLVWSRDRIFIKPLPRWLLEPDFWVEYILADSKDLADPRLSYVAAAARGFLHSYCALVAYESDFRIAQNEGLLPSDISWAGWKQLTRQVLERHNYLDVNPRYWYGELRLGRLNHVYRFKGHIFRGYSRIAAHAAYADLLADNFAILTAMFGYLVIVLSAMQVGLGTEKLSSSTAFQDVSYGFTVLSLVAPPAAAFVIVTVVIFMFVSNWLATNAYEYRRLPAMGLPKRLR